MAVEVAVLESGTHMGVDLKVVKNTFIVRRDVRLMV